MKLVSLQKILIQEARKLRVNRMKEPNKPLIKLGLISMFVILLSSCNVQEWPQPVYETFDYTLALEFDSELPLYQTVVYSRGEDRRVQYEDYDIRYIVKVYQVKDENDANRNVFASFVFTRSYTQNHNYEVKLPLPVGTYLFRIWSDHVDKNSQSDKFYLTSDFSAIQIDGSEAHPGNNELRDAFRGSAYGKVYDDELYFLQTGIRPSNKTVVELKRPLGRYEFISTDMDEFLDKEVRSRGEEFYKDLLTKASSRGDVSESFFNNNLTREDVATAIELDKYKVVISYNAFMPSTYNLYGDFNGNSSTGIQYNGNMSVGEKGITLGFDYIFSDSEIEENTMSVNLEIFNKEGTIIASTSAVRVPIVRGKNTNVTGAFLTAINGGGVSINPGYEGDDYNIEIF